MAEAAILDRRGPLTGRRSASVTALPSETRFSLRGEASALAAIAVVFGVAPSPEVCRAATSGGNAALWLGPDEWMLVAPDGEAAALFTSLAQSLAGVPHSLVDISHRNTGFLVAGEGAEILLGEGCPLDLSLAACPIGMSTRTVLGKCEIVLWRVAADTFRIECWRSFASYLSGFLAQAAENL